MLARLIGAVAGALVAAFGYGLWRPAQAAILLDPGLLDLAELELGPFAPYRTALAFTLMGAGLAITIAALLRKTGRPGRRKPLALGAEADGRASDPFTLTDPGSGAPA